MVPTTILVDDAPKCVVRPVDQKDLTRFLRNARPYLLRATPDGKIAHRAADDVELAKWRDARDLHAAWGGTEEEFFGTPL